MTYEQCLGLTCDKWIELDDSQKIEVLQTIENQMAIEAGRAACPVVGRWLYSGEDGIVLGSYSRDSQTIYINASQFDPDSKYGQSPDRIITTCIHEGRHAYQNQVVNGIVEHDNPGEAEIWKENLSDDGYISYQENPVAYYMQPVETDARSFAEHRMSMLQEERSAFLHKDSALTSARATFEQQMSNNDSESSQVAHTISESTSNSVSSISQSKIS